MLIKLGKAEHIYNLSNKGEMFFNTCKYFRDLEEEQLQKGIGDVNDGGVHAITEKVRIISPNFKKDIDEYVDAGFIVKPALNVPVFCLRKTESSAISYEMCNKIKNQFPKYTHALIIENEKEFLENVRYSFRNKAFAHKIFYQNGWYEDFLHFIYSGSSDIRFYPTRVKGNKYYADICLPENLYKKNTIRIDDSNFYRMMYRKDMFFEEQQEYRIVLPRETIEEGKVYTIKPFKAKICYIEDLIDKESK